MMTKEFNLSEKIKELFDRADKGKIGFLLNTREIAKSRLGKDVRAIDLHPELKKGEEYEK